MSSNNKIQEAFKNILSVKNEKEKIETFASIIQLDIMNDVSSLMQAKGMNKKQLAEKLGVSKSYVTQMFTVDKNINLKLIAQIQSVFNVKFCPQFISREEYASREIKTQTLTSQNESCKSKLYVIHARPYTADESGFSDDISSKKPQTISGITLTSCIEQVQPIRMTS